MVRVLRASGIDLETIARALCIDPKTLGKYFKVELTFGHEDIKARMGLALVRVALQGNVNAIKYWLATHGGAEWRVPKDDADGATIIIKGGLPATAAAAAAAMPTARRAQSRRSCGQPHGVLVCTDQHDAQRGR